MNPYTPLLFGGIIFLIVAIMHLLRLIFKTEVVIGGKPLSMNISILGFIVSLFMCFWMFSALF